MASSFIQCHICSVVFASQEELREHLWQNQVELGAVLVDLQRLLAHQSHGTSVNAQDTSSSPSSGETPQALPVTFPLEGHSRFDLHGAQAHATPTTALPNRVRDRILCPHPDCQRKNRGYSRKQDLVRHYADHLEVPEFCHFCCRTMKASQYIKHPCAKAGPPNQQKYVLQRIKALRSLASGALRGNTLSARASVCSKSRSASVEQTEAVDHALPQELVDDLSLQHFLPDAEALGSLWPLSGTNSLSLEEGISETSTSGIDIIFDGLEDDVASRLAQEQVYQANELWFTETNLTQ